MYRDILAGTDGKDELFDREMWSEESCSATH